MKDYEQRPWGEFETLAEGDNFKVKKLTVNPGGHLSLQSHKFREETWVIIQGQAEVIVGDTTAQLLPGSRVGIEVGDIHRLKNSGDEPLIVVEVQYGSYLGEDDIIRYEDIYGRSQ